MVSNALALTSLKSNNISLACALLNEKGVACINANIPAEAPAMDTTFNACLLEITALMILSKSTVCFGGFTISSNSSNEILFSVNV